MGVTSPCSGLPGADAKPGRAAQVCYLVTRAGQHPPSAGQTVPCPGTPALPHEWDEETDQHMEEVVSCEFV